MTLITRVFPESPALGAMWLWEISQFDWNLTFSASSKARILNIKSPKHMKIKDFWNFYKKKIEKWRAWLIMLIVQRRGLFKHMVCSHSPDPESTKNPKPKHFKKSEHRILCQPMSLRTLDMEWGRTDPELFRVWKQVCILLAGIVSL